MPSNTEAFWAVGLYCWASGAFTALAVSGMRLMWIPAAIITATALAGIITEGRDRDAALTTTGGKGEGA